MLIGGLQKFTALDYPEKIAATIFTVGCNFRCPYCHNIELVESSKFDKTNLIPEAYVLEFLKGRKGDLDGVCISGGEPTLQMDLIDFIRKVKKMNFLVKLDTNGSNPKIVQKVLDENLLDYVAIDVKTAFNKYELVKASSAIALNVLESIDIITEKGVALELRTTIVPGIVDASDFDEIIKAFNEKNEKILKNLFRYTLQNFRPQRTLEESFASVSPYGEQVFASVSDKLKKYCSRVDILM
jgi:pyruvate formate lyase activating enzyme